MIVHGDIAERACVATASLSDLDEKVLEHVPTVRRTALVRLQPGATLPVFEHGRTEIFVLEGERAGWYLANLPLPGPAVAIVKQRPARDRTPRAIDSATVAFEPAQTPRLWRAPLHSDEDGDVVLLRFEAGMTIGPHVHEAGEEFLVLDGELRDEHGSYPRYAWVRQPPDSVHSVASPQGCTLLTFAHHLRY
jgi:hypothetical protein